MTQNLERDARFIRLVDQQKLFQSHRIENPVLAGNGRRFGRNIHGGER